MKKFLLFIPLMLLSIALSACGSSNEETNTPGVPENLVPPLLNLVQAMSIIL